MGCGFSGDDKPIEYGLSKMVSCYILFGLKARQGGLLTKMCEDITDNATDKVDLRKFAFNYCGNNAETLMFLWIKFNMGVMKVGVGFDGGDDDDKKKKDDDDDDDDHDDDDDDEDGKHEQHNEEEQKAMAESKHASKLAAIKGKKEGEVTADDMFQTSHHVFLFFLLVFLSRSDKDLMQYLYYLRFTLPKVRPTNATLSKLVDSLWGNLEAVKFKKTQVRKAAEKFLGRKEESVLCANAVSM
jgi:hypothetical protein